ncbi:MAG TPA: NAD-dependent epimerase/dehydratase family protein [Bacteroidaceae bacterium]|nr:NAD-dependent epimerase/dehydratase family protein [Bacteroidaceae bacterium]
MKILVTGAAGFIGSQLAIQLSRRGDQVVGLDNINNYYDIRLKYGRLAECGIITEKKIFTPGKFYQSSIFHNYRFVKLDIADRKAMEDLFAVEKFQIVVNLAAQAGVRYSISNPYAYLDSNLTGFLNVLECCRINNIGYLVYASSSSVYGMNDKVPFSEDDKVDNPVSFYAATKKANELMAHSYSKLYGFSTTGLRYFTVYGPWGRPDMAPMLFAAAVDGGKPINVFNNGNMLRDFTYIDDIVKGTIQVIDNCPEASKCPDRVPAKIYNIGCSNPVNLMDFISEIEKIMGKEAKKNFLPMQQGDVIRTFADTSRLEQEIGYKPTTTLREGITAFIEWFNSSKNPLR